MRSGRTAVAVVLMLGAVACTAQQPRQVRAAPSAKPAAPSCGSGAFRWGAVRQETRLTGVSPVVTLGKADGWTTFRNVPVRTIAASIRTNGVELSRRRAMSSLARHLGYDTGDLMAPGEDTAHHPRHHDRIDFDLAGRFVTAEAVKVVDASFAVSCPDGTHYGSVTTWLTGTRGASLSCGTDPGGEAWVREAYRLACGPLSPR
ncbi:hypothetical protein C3492_04215 [Streptomyces sp. Ru62]|uniref:hypothetical protein n=1 Tax=Streptomyces sp. Ru62 TaxID=2080745 RepID=UPI000CDD77EB|nr:hypothetical protein [Streptomyces sp. Ru62]POX64945.1 hypothetical protein C3492_04215 [Streptomyces sp. Ru62]